MTSAVIGILGEAVGFYDFFTDAENCNGLFSFIVLFLESEEYTARSHGFNKII
jgi:hypothetical protein